MNRHEYIRQWREDLGLALPLVAQATGLAEPDLREIEQGTRVPSLDELESLARVLGFRADELVVEPVPTLKAGSDPLRMLLKSAEEFNPPQQVRLQMIDAARAALDLLDLKVLLKERMPPGLEKFSLGLQPDRSKPAYQEANKLARQVRSMLPLTGPIASMRDLISETLGIPILLADLSSDGPDAFTVYAPGRRAAMVLNAVGKNENALVRRFSLAHELYHALFNRPAAGPLGMACWQDMEMKLDREIRANAFAIRLLMPESVVTQKGEEIFQPHTFRELMVKYGVHFQALQLFVKKLHRLSDEEASERLPDVVTTPPLSWRVAEELPAETLQMPDIPLTRRGELALSAARAYTAGHISRSHLRELLRIDATVELERLFSMLDVRMPD